MRKALNLLCNFCETCFLTGFEKGNTWLRSGEKEKFKDLV